MSGSVHPHPRIVSVTQVDVGLALMASTRREWPVHGVDEGRVPSSLPKCCRFQVGLTLMEVMISTFLGGMVLIGLSIAYAYAVGLWGNAERKVAMHVDGTFAVEAIARAASQAEAMSIGPKRLELTLPASPLIKDAVVLQKVFRLTDEALWVDDSLLIPSPGDSGIGVAEFIPEEAVDEASGVQVLAFKLCLFSRESLVRSADSMWFASEVHLRNRGVGPMSQGKEHGEDHAEGYVEARGLWASTASVASLGSSLSRLWRASL